MIKLERAMTIISVFHFFLKVETSARLILIKMSLLLLEEQIFRLVLLLLLLLLTLFNVEIKNSSYYTNNS